MRSFTPTSIYDYGYCRDPFVVRPSLYCQSLFFCSCFRHWLVKFFIDSQLIVSSRWLCAPPVTIWPQTAAKLHSHLWYCLGPFTLREIDGVLAWELMQVRISFRNKDHHILLSVQSSHSHSLDPFIVTASRRLFGQNSLFSFAVFLLVSFSYSSSWIHACVYS